MRPLLQGGLESPRPALAHCATAIIQGYLPLTDWEWTKVRTVFGKFAHTDKLPDSCERLDIGALDPIRLASHGPRVDIALHDAGFEQDIDRLRVSPALRIGEMLPRSTKARFLSVEPSTSARPASLRNRAVVGIDTASAEAELVAHKDHIVLAGALAVRKTVIDAVGLPER